MTLSMTGIVRLGLDAFRRDYTNSKTSHSIPSLPIPKLNLPSKRKNPPSAIPKSLSATQSALNPIKSKSPIQ